MTSKLHACNLFTNLGILVRHALIITASVFLGYSLQTPIEVVAATPFHPSPTVQACEDVWHTLENAPDFMWDTTDSSSTADHYTVTVTPNGIPHTSPPTPRGQWATTPPSPNGYAIITWWDTDRPGQPQALHSYGIQATPTKCQ